MKNKNIGIRRYIDSRAKIALILLGIGFFFLIVGEVLIFFILTVGSFSVLYLLINEGDDYNVSELNKLRVLRFFNRDAAIFRVKSENNNYYILTLENNIDSSMIVGRKMYKYFSESSYATESTAKSNVIFLDINEEILRLENEVNTKKEIKNPSFVAVERKPIFSMA